METKSSVSFIFMSHLVSHQLKFDRSLNFSWLQLLQPSTTPTSPTIASSLLFFTLPIFHSLLQQRHCVKSMWDQICVWDLWGIMGNISSEDGSDQQSKHCGTNYGLSVVVSSSESCSSFSVRYFNAEGSFQLRQPLNPTRTCCHGNGLVPKWVRTVGFDPLEVEDHE